jgi:hypothetical protein
MQLLDQVRRRVKSRTGRNDAHNTCLPSNTRLQERRRNLVLLYGRSYLSNGNADTQFHAEVAMLVNERSINKWKNQITQVLNRSIAGSICLWMRLSQSVQLDCTFTGPMRVLYKHIAFSNEKNWTGSPCPISGVMNVCG